jgi:hypothetical protein
MSAVVYKDYVDHVNINILLLVGNKTWSERYVFQFKRHFVLIILGNVIMEDLGSNI